MVVPLGNSRDIIAYECDPGLGLQVGLGRTEFFFAYIFHSTSDKFQSGDIHFSFHIPHRMEGHAKSLIIK